jgi:hypothetical protein
MTVHLQDSASPSAAEPRASASVVRAPSPWLVGFLAVVATALELVRQPGTQSWNSIWQEDGGVFLTDVLGEGFLKSLVEPYNAYLHLIARLCAGVVALFPLEQAALMLSLTAAAVTSAIAVYVYYASASVFHTQWARVLLAVSVVLLPAAGYETNANIANLHWYLIFGCFWVFVAAPRSTAGIVLGAVITALAVLSDPLTGILTPLALWQLWTDRTARGRVVPVVFAVTMAIQLVLGVVSDPVAPYAQSFWADLPGIYALRVAASFLVGDQFLDDLWRPWGAPFAFAALAVVAAVCAYGFAKARRAGRVFLAVCLALSVLYIVIPLMLRGTENFLDRAEFNLNGSRYTLLPILFLTTAVLYILDRRDPRVSPETWRSVQIGFTAFAGALILVNFSIGTTRTAGPRWDDALAAARQQCREGRYYKPGDPYQVGAYSTKQLPYGDVRIPVAPNIQPVSFGVAISCERLR